MQVSVCKALRKVKSQWTLTSDGVVIQASFWVLKLQWLLQYPFRLVYKPVLLELASVEYFLISIILL